MSSIRPGRSGRFRCLIKAAALTLSLTLGAGLMALSLGSASHSWLGWVTLLPLLLAIRLLTPRWAGACGALWGGTLYLFSTALIDTPIPPTMRSLVLLAAIPAAYAFLGALLTRRTGFSALCLGFGWFGVELALKPLGLPGSLLVGVQGGGSLAYFVQGLLGSAVVASVVAVVNGLLASALTRVQLRIPRKTLVIHSYDKPSKPCRTLLRSKCPSVSIHCCGPRAPPLWPD